MPQIDFEKTRKQAEEQGLLGGGDFYKYKEGNNRIRLLSECLPHTSVFEGKNNFKWLCYILDRRDGKVHAHFMPHTIYKAIEALQQNPDYAFREVPMPYDITVNAVKAGTKDVTYTVLPAKHETPLTEDELEDYGKQKPLAEIKAALKQDKQPAKTNGGGTSVVTAAEFPYGDNTPLGESELPEER
jgi:hypothetical protein